MAEKKIAVFVTGGIAAYKVPQLVRDLIKAGSTVQVAMTRAAAAFVTPQTLAVVSKHKVLTDETEFASAEHVAHVALAHWADLALVVPATANTMAKLAFGLADNVVTTTLLAFNGPKLVVPAMNDQMWLNPQTQANVAHLTANGYRILPPATGFLAEGYSGVGRMPDLAVIETFVETYQSEQFLQGKKLVITAGGTQEPLDPVRYLSNVSSGKMGTALANTAASAGGDVLLVTTADLPVLPQVKVAPVQTAAEMAQAVYAAFDDCQIAIMAAAVADFRPESASTQKIKKTGSSSELTLNLVQNPDILKTIAQRRKGQFVAGFAAETQDLMTNAAAKLKRKNADLLWPDGTKQPLGHASKIELAGKILQAISKKVG